MFMVTKKARERKKKKTKKEKMQLFGKITKADLYRRLLGFYGMDNKISPLK